MALAAFLAAVPAARADVPFVQVFTTRAAFNAVAPGLPIEDFEEARMPIDGSFPTMQSPLDRTTDNDIFHKGEILEGLRIYTKWTGGSGYDPPLEVRKTSLFSTYLDCSFDCGLTAIFYNGASRAVGMDLYPGAGVTDWTVDVYGMDGALLHEGSLRVPLGGAFFGVISSSVIGRVEVLGNQDFVAELDNVTFNAGPAPEPEPSSWLLLLTAGAAAMLTSRRKWRRKDA